MPLPLNEHGRIDGCQSANHTECEPETEELWECDRCRRSFCWGEGHANHRPEMCDDCAFILDELGKQRFAQEVESVGTA